MSMKDFRTLEPVGKGAFASVFKVQRKSDNKIYALKRVDISKMSKREIADALNEIRILASVRHPYIVGFMQAFTEKNDKELNIIMEFCGCGDLAAKVERYRKRKQYIDERVVWSHFIQMADALSCLHDKQIVHRDLKTANCFLAEDGSVKIGDLNVSKRMKNGLLRTQIGTPYYMSPEIWGNKPYDASSDVWALGCLIYELCALRPPFVGDSFAQLKKAVLAGRYPAVPKTYSYEISGLIGRMVRVNQRERPTIKQLLESDEVKKRRKADWYKGADQPERGEVSLMNTIAVPHNMRQLTNNLPKPCFPDQRPNSPESWPVTDRNRDDAVAAKKAGQPIPSGGDNENAAPNARGPPPTMAAKPGGAALPIQPKGSAAALHGAAPTNAPRPTNVPQSRQVGSRAPPGTAAQGQQPGTRKPLGTAQPSRGGPQYAAAYGQQQHQPKAPTHQHGGAARPSGYGGGYAQQPGPPGTRAPGGGGPTAAGYNRRRY